MRTPEEIVGLYEQRRSEQTARLRIGDEVLRAYAGQLKIDLPEIDATEESFVGNLLNQGVDALGQAIGSTLPDSVFHPTKPHIRSSQKAARDKRAAVLGWWEANAMQAKLRRRSRYYVGHGLTAVTLRPDTAREAPMWQIRNPLETFPGSCLNVDDVCPMDTIFAYQRSLQWLKAHYPLAAAKLKDDRDTNRTKFEVVEYVDATCTVLLARNIISQMGASRKPPEILETIEYDYGTSPAIVLSRVSLGAPAGQFDQMPAMYKMRARLMAMEVIQMQRSIWPETWLEERMGDRAEVVTHADGALGEIGMVRGGALKWVTEPTNYAGFQTTDRIAEAERQTARIPSEWGGQSGSNIRTGRRGDAILSATIDGTIQEAQDELARSLEAENRVAIRLQKYHFGARKISFYVSSKGAKGHHEYVPNDLFDNDNHKVAYSLAGADANGLVIAIGQRIGMQTLSKKTGMVLDPFIEDPELEHDQVTFEAMEAAVLSGFQNGLASGQIPVSDGARVMDLVQSDKMELAAAIIKVQREAQERQSAQVPAGSPEAMPGLAVAGAGAESATIPEPPQGGQNLASLLQSLRNPQRRVASEQPAAV